MCLYRWWPKEERDPNEHYSSMTFRKQSLTKNQPGIWRLRKKGGRGAHDVRRALDRRSLNGRISGVWLPEIKASVWWGVTMEASSGMLGLGRQWKPFFFLLCKGVPVRCHHHDRVLEKEEIFITTVICRDLSLWSCGSRVDQSGSMWLRRSFD